MMPLQEFMVRCGVTLTGTSCTEAILKRFFACSHCEFNLESSSLNSQWEQAKNLLRIASVHEVPVRVTPHRTMNSCKGIIRSSDLAQLDEDELLSELPSQNVM